MEFHVHRRFVIATSYTLVLILIFLCGAFIYRYNQVAPMKVINPQRFSTLRADHIHLGVNDVSAIAPWMTFDFINHVFNLPPEYLKTTLSITDARYPTLTISHYATESKITTNQLTAQVQNIVKNYFTSSVVPK